MHVAFGPESIGFLDKNELLYMYFLMALANQVILLHLFNQ